MTAIHLVAALVILGGVACTQARDTLDRLTVPPGLLPTGCKLRPSRSDGPFRSNPATGTDSVTLGFIAMFFRPLSLATEAEESAARAAEAAATGPEERRAAFERLMAQRASAVESGYAAFYREEGGSPEIGVYALRFKKPLPELEAERFRTGSGAGGPTALRIAKGSVAIFAWSDARQDAPDRGCFEVVRRHIEQAEVE